MCRKMRVEPARTRHRQSPRVSFRAHGVWTDRVSASRFCAEYQADCLPASVTASTFASGPLDVRQLPGPWKLPAWHVPAAPLPKCEVGTT
eukprot:8610459-Pyramimonas_sp.AAC.1